MAYAYDWSQNIRTHFPQLTQKEAHIFSNLPFDEILGLDYPYYFWRAKVENLGGNTDLAEVLTVFKRNNFTDLRFWESVIRFCVAYAPELEQLHQTHADTYQNLFGYLSHKRHEEGNLFEMKGRSLRVVLQQAETWYAEMQRNRYAQAYYAKSWKGAGYLPYESTQEEAVYTITQLLTAEALQIEGALLHHCVAGYGYKCSTGSCSIWSLRVSMTGEKAQSLVTIEIDNNRNIVQAKAMRNAQPQASHLSLIKEWATREDIVFVRC